MSGSSKRGPVRLVPQPSEVGLMELRLDVFSWILLILAFLLLLRGHWVLTVLLFGLELAHQGEERR
jgi:hypothetical protein